MESYSNQERGMLRGHKMAEESMISFGYFSDLLVNLPNNQKKDFIEIRRDRKTLLDLDVGDLVRVMGIINERREDKGLVLMVDKGGFSIGNLSDEESEREMFKRGWPGYGISIAIRDSREDIRIDSYNSSQRGIFLNKQLSRHLPKRDYSTLIPKLGVDMGIKTSILYEYVSHGGYNWIEIHNLLKEKGL